MHPYNNVEGDSYFPEKTNRWVSLFRRVQDVTAFIGLVQVMFLTLIILIKFCFRALSYLMKSGQCVRAISAFLTSTRFVFVLGNVIIIALYVISAWYPPEEDEPSSDDHVHVEYVEKCDFNPSPPPRPPPRRRVVVEDNEAGDVHPYNVPCVDKEVISHVQPKKVVKPPADHAAALCHNARRGKIESIRKVGLFYRKKDWVSAWASAYAPAPAPTRFRRYAADDLSSEEFRMMVDDYIARQRRVLREESRAAAYYT